MADHFLPNHPKRPLGHFYQAYVYTRRPVRGGLIRLYLRDPKHRRVGFVETTPKAAAMFTTGDMYKWGPGVITHAWKLHNPRLYRTQP